MALGLEVFLQPFTHVCVPSAMKVLVPVVHRDLQPHEKHACTAIASLGEKFLTTGTNTVCSVRNHTLGGRQNQKLPDLQDC